jgi:hypothetical protein
MFISIGFFHGLQRGLPGHSDVIVYIKGNGFITKLLPYNFAIFNFFAIYVDFIPLILNIPLTHLEKLTVADPDYLGTTSLSDKKKEPQDCGS